MKKYILVGIALALMIPYAVAQNSTSSPKAGKVAAAKQDDLAAWFATAQLKLLLLKLEVENGDSKAIDHGVEIKAELDKGFQAAVASAKGRPELVQATKDYYLAATRFTDELNRISEIPLDRAADRLKMELQLAHRF